MDFKKIFLFTFLLAFLVVPSVNAWSSDYSTWNNRRALNVTHSTNSNTDTDMQVYVNITWKANMSTTFSDLRFTFLNTTDSTEYAIPYWIEENVTSSWATVWTKVPTLRANQNETLYMYYNKTGATNAGNASAVFVRYTGFENNAINVTNSINGLEWVYVQNSVGTNSVNANVTTVKPRQGTYAVNVTGTGGGNNRGGLGNFSWINTTNTRFVVWYNISKTLNIAGGIIGWSGANSAGTQFQTNLQQIPDCPTGVLCTYDGSTWQASGYNYSANTWAKQIVVVNSSGIFAFLNNMTAIVRKLGTSTTIGTLTVESGDGSIDDLYQTKYSYPESTLTQGVQESNIAPSMINIYNVTNTTYFILYNFNYTFSSISNSYSTFTLNATLDGVRIYNNASYNNNTNVTVMYNFSSIDITALGLHNLTVNDNSSTQSIFFTIKDHQVMFESYENTTYETNTTNYTIKFTVNGDWYNYNTTRYNQSRLYWNGSLVGPQSYQTILNTSNGVNITNSRNYTIPLVQANNTNITHFWELGPIPSGFVCSVTPCWVNENTTSVNQSVYFAYFLSGASQFQSANSLTEGDNFTNWLNITAILQNAVIRANATYRSVNYTLNNTTNYYNFSGIISSGLVSGSARNESYGIISNATVTFNSLSRVLSSENDTVTIYKLILTDCSVGSASTTKTLNFTLKQELDPTGALVNGTMEIYLNVSTNYLNARNYSFFFQNVTTAAVCIYPVNSTLNLDSLNKYYDYNGTYSARYYYIQNTTINNVTTNIDFYLLPTSRSSQSTFFLTNENFEPYTNAIIQVQRLYIFLNNTYKTVAQCKSDDPDGKCPVPLEVYNPLYKYTVIKNGVVVKETTPAAIVCQVYQSFTNCATQGYPIPIVVSAATPNTYFQIFQNTSSGCTLNTSTNVLRCVVSDLTGKMTQSHLIVNQSGAVTDTTICDNTDTSSGTTFTCSLGNITNTLYSYQFLGTFSGIQYILDSGHIGTRSALIDFGAMGLLIAFLVIGTLFFMGVAFGPIVSMLLALAGVIAGFWIGFVPVTYPALTGLIVSSLIIIYKMRA